MLSSGNKHNGKSSDYSVLSINRLIDLVKQNPILYEAKQNFRNSGFTSKNMSSQRNSAWEAIGKDLNHAPDECKKKWKYLRDGYVRSMKTNGSNLHHHILSFLDDHIDCTNSKPSHTKNSNKDNNQVLITLDMIQSLVNEKTDDDENDDALVDATSDVLSSLFNKSLEDTINKFTEPKCSAHQSSTIEYPDEYPKKVEETAAECCSSIIISDVVSLSTEGRNSESEDLTELNSLKRKLHNSNETEIPNSKTLKTDLVEPSKEQPDIAVFFKDIGEYVTARFPLKKQIELRMKVLSLVTQAELELLHGEED